MDETLWQASAYGQVHAALSASLECVGRNLVPGTGGAIARSLDSLKWSGESEAVARLERIALTIANLQLALRERDDEAWAESRIALGRMADEWLAAAPMLPQAHC